MLLLLHNREIFHEIVNWMYMSSTELKQANICNYQKSFIILTFQDMQISSNGNYTGMYLNARTVQILFSFFRISKIVSIKTKDICNIRSDTKTYKISSSQFPYMFISDNNHKCCCNYITYRMNKCLLHALIHF